MNRNQLIRDSYFECLRNAFAEEEIDEILIEVPVELLDSRLINFSESKWMPSFKPCWSYRIDPENTNTKTQRHVHVAKTKQITAPHKQASWNLDRTRHDTKKFNPDVGNKSIAQQIARTALRLPDDAVLECFSFKGSVLLVENADLKGTVFCFSAKITDRSGCRLDA